MNTWNRLRTLPCTKQHSINHNMKFRHTYAHIHTRKLLATSTDITNPQNNTEQNITLSQLLNLYQRLKAILGPAQGHSQYVIELGQEPNSNSKPYPFHKHFCVPKNISQTDSFKKIRYSSFCAATSHLCSTLL